MRMPRIVSHPMDSRIYLSGKLIGKLPLVHFKDTIRDFEIFISQNRWEQIIASGSVIDFPSGWKKHSFVEIFVRVPKKYKWWFRDIDMLYIFNDYNVREFVLPTKHGAKGHIHLEVIDSSKKRFFNSEKDAKIFMRLRWWFAFENYCKRWWEKHVNSGVKIIPSRTTHDNSQN